MIHPTLYRTIYAGCKRDGGITIGLEDGERPDKGYAVALPGHEEVIPVLGVGAMFVAIDGYIARHPGLHEPGRYLGVWLHRGQGQWYFDVVEVIQDRHRALAAARERNQQAIFRLDDSTEIPTQDDGDE